MRHRSPQSVSTFALRFAPAFLAVLFDERLLAQGLDRTLALHLFETSKMSPAQAARLAGLAAEEFVALLGRAGIDAVSYQAADLEAELRAAL